MTTQEIADRLVALNRANEYETVYQELYDPEVVSVEKWGGEAVEYKGMAAIMEKMASWQNGVGEMHETRVSDPLVADQSFAVTFYMDVTYIDGGMFPAGRSQMTELAVYTVRDGKIIREEFQA